MTFDHFSISARQTTSNLSGGERGIHTMRGERFPHLDRQNEIFDLAIEAARDRTRSPRRQPDPVPVLLVAGNAGLERPR
jgi:hypothetical protein